MNGDVKELTEMEINSQIKIKGSNNSPVSAIFVLRVYNGWIYNIYGARGMTSTFVPQQLGAEQYHYHREQS